jgi:hypothetical protein
MAFIPGSDLNVDERKVLLDLSRQPPGALTNGHSVVQSLIHKGYASESPEGPVLTRKGKLATKHVGD